MNLQTHTRQQQGVIIIENLIAILIFSVGILGLAGLLVTSMKTSASARNRSEASLYANQIIGQMWVSDKANAALKASFESPSGTAYTGWASAVAAALPGASSTPPTISIDSGNTATITISWTDQGASASHQYVAVAHISD